MKLLYACGIAWILFVGLQIGKFGYDTRYSWGKQAQSAGVLLSSGSSTSWQVSGTPVSVHRLKKSLATDKPPMVAPPHNHPPLVFVAGANLWRIYYTTAEFMSAADCGAWTDSDAHEVWLSIEDARQQETLTHELMHVARAVGRENDPYRDSYDRTDPADENYFVTPTAPYFQRMLRDNKQLAQWIAK